MNWNQIQPSLQQFKSAVMETWEWFMDEQLDVIKGDQNYFIVNTHKAYVITDEEAEQRLAAWQQQQRDKIRKSSGSF